MATTTLRITDKLRDEAASYAAELGISFNALAAIALKHYLEARGWGRRERALGSPAVPAIATMNRAERRAAARKMGPKKGRKR